ncbi:hypothetical protein HYS79_01215 [Patescibacteria group bacterium]|nr:hypothetical protein [Patescibacteria group bacterium]
MNTVALVYQDHLSKIIAALAGLVVVALFLYGFFLLEAVMHTAARADAEVEILATNARLSILESQYLTLTRTMTPGRAQELGFVPPTAVTTVFATDATRSLSLSGPY